MSELVEEGFRYARYTIEESINYLQTDNDTDMWLVVGVTNCCLKLQELSNFIRDNIEQIMLYEQNCDETKSFVDECHSLLNLENRIPSLPELKWLYERCAELRGLLVGIRCQVDAME